MQQKTMKGRPVAVRSKNVVAAVTKKKNTPKTKKAATLQNGGNMAGNCPKCGLPLNKGNIKVVRRKGHRPRREHRSCKINFPHAEPVPPLIKTTVVQFPPVDTSRMLKLPKPFDNARGKPQDTKGGPVTVDMVYQESPTVRYRLFVNQDGARKLRRAVESGIGFYMLDVKPVPADQVDANPDAFDALTEIKVHWGNE